jgi:hypothetical protein
MAISFVVPVLFRFVNMPPSISEGKGEIGTTMEQLRQAGMIFSQFH